MLLLRDHASQYLSVPDSRFQFTQVSQTLDKAAELDPLHRALQHDYQLLDYLLHHAAGLELATIEDRLLVLDYKLMQAWYRIVRFTAPQQARGALREMADVLGVLAHRMTEQAAIRNQA